MFGKDISAADEPEIQAESEDKWFCSGFLELVNTGFCSEGRHCHGQQEGVEIVDGIDEYSRKKVERVEADDGKETYGEPGYIDFALFSCNSFG